VLHVSGAYPEPWKVKLYATFTVPPGTCAGVVEIIGGAGLFTVIVKGVAAEDWPKVSLTVKVIATLCFVVGVPETTPLPLLSARLSAGRPVELQVSVPEPVAWNAKVYAIPMVPGAAVTCACVVVITGTAGLLTVSTNAVGADDWPNVSLTVKVKLSVAFEVGVPESTPELAPSDNASAGRPVALHVRGPLPVATKEKL
jgi:hypothetical protein